MSALIVRSVVFYMLYVDGPPTHPGQYLWHRLPYATSRPRLAYRRYLSFSVCMCFCLLADVNLDQTGRSTQDLKKGYKTKTGSTSSVTLALIKTEYWDRAGGGRNIRYEW